MKLLSLILLVTGVVPAFGQWVVNDPVNTAVNTAIKGNQIAQHTEVIRQWAEQLEKLNRQIRQVEDLLALQRELRDVMGNPGRAGERVVRRTLGHTEFGRSYGETVDAVRRLSDAVDSLRRTAHGIHRSLDDRTVLGSPFARELSQYRRYAAVERQADGLAVVFDATDAELLAVQADLADAIADLRSATTQAETDKLNGTIAALNGRLAVLAARRSEETDKVLVAQLLNENQADKERRDLQEKQIAEERQSLAAINAWQSSLRLTPVRSTRP
ncbi:MAG: hypothetical protein Q8M02_13230 [Candidatus Didemnitutus sp.]|nr:hypothetical protein [Candidatus Didemnitutus sp.]